MLVLLYYDTYSKRALLRLSFLDIHLYRCKTVATSISEQYWVRIGLGVTLRCASRDIHLLLEKRRNIIKCKKTHEHHHIVTELCKVLTAYNIQSTQSNIWHYVESSCLDLFLHSFIRKKQHISINHFVFFTSLASSERMFLCVIILKHYDYYVLFSFN